MKLKKSLLYGLVAGGLMLSACSDDAKKKATPKVEDLDDEKLPEGPPSIEVTSHADGQDVFGSRTITFAGTLTSPTPISEVTVVLNGADAEVTWDQTSFSAALPLADRANTITVTAENALGEVSSVTLAVRYPFLSFTNGQAASLVIGQDNFTTSFSGTGAHERNFGWGNPAVASDGKLYIPDMGNNRVLGYNTFPTANGASADFVLGQPWFGTSSSANSRSGLNAPSSVAIEGTTMAVAIRSLNRVHLYFGLPVTSTDLPDVVVGQPNFDTANAGCSATSMNWVHDAFLVNGKLIVSEYSNNRVTIWNSLPTTNGTAPDLVLGQTNFTSCNAGLGAGQLSGPMGVWSDGTRLIVLDSDNWRILIWNTFPTTNGQAADVVLGQANMTAKVAAPSTASGMDWPAFVTSNGNQIFVADCGKRVMIWDSFPTTNNKAADRVLGQANLTDSVDATTASSLDCPAGLELVGDTKLMVSDTDNRVLVYKAP